MGASVAVGQTAAKRTVSREWSGLLERIDGQRNGSRDAYVRMWGTASRVHFAVVKSRKAALQPSASGHVRRAHTPLRTCCAGSEAALRNAAAGLAMLRRPATWRLQ